VESAAIQETSGLVSYGWGMIPVAAQIGDTVLLQLGAVRLGP
jgi:hypothetical protein